MYPLLWPKNGHVASVNTAEHEETEFMSMIQKNSYQQVCLLNLLKYWENCNVNGNVRDS